MALLEGKTPAERNKTIAAIVLGALALLSLSYLLLGSSGKKSTVANANRPKPRTSPTPAVSKSPVGDVVDVEDVELKYLQKVDYQQVPPAIPEAGRNIFAFYEGPPVVKPAAGAAPTPVEVPTPTPVPPNMMLSAISPANVYARTGDFTLEVIGDKFTPAVRIQIGGTEVPTRFISPQQLSANVSGSVISFAGPRQVEVRSPDGQLFSNSATFNVQEPPKPNYSFVGLLAKPGSNDTALLKDRGSRDLLSVHRGDTLGGRFRVTSISEREVIVMDTNLKIKHPLPLTSDGGGATTGSPNNAAPTTGFPNPNQRYTPPPQGDDDDEEP